jgi:hypothetical protein
VLDVALTDQFVVGASRHDFLRHRIAGHSRGLRGQQSVC